MPFDALLAPPRPMSLAEILDECRVSPVPLEALAEHKRAQLERFGPSFWYRHHAWLPVGLIGSVACMAISGGTAGRTLPGSLAPSWLSLSWLVMILLLIVFGVFRVSPGARWQERRVAGGTLPALGVPGPIARLAHALQREMTDSVLRLGELVREEAVLDPYLLLESGEERICLGIWDDLGIIAEPRCRRIAMSPTIERALLPADFDIHTKEPKTAGSESAPAAATLFTAPAAASRRSRQ